MRNNITKVLNQTVRYGCVLGRFVLSLCIYDTFLTIVDLHLHAILGQTSVLSKRFSDVVFYS